MTEDERRNLLVILNRQDQALGELRQKARERDHFAAAAQRAEQRARDAEERVKRYREELLRRPPRLRSGGWATPGPALCPKCGNLVGATAYATGEGWLLELTCQECGTEIIPADEIPWPFAHEECVILPEDLERIGFEVLLRAAMNSTPT